MRAGRRIFAIEDDPPTARLFRLILEPEGYELSLFSDRQQALDMIVSDTPDLVIMDYFTAGIGPGAFIERARDSGFSGPILLCTALDRNPGLPVDDVLLKPFDVDDLLKRTAVLLASSNH